MPRTVALVTTGIAGLGAATLAYAGLWERNAFTLRRATVPVLPPGSTPVRLLHISDVHMLGRQKQKQAWIRDLGRLLPDLVVSTGDHLAGADGIPAILDALGPLLDRPGAFVLGSNDYFAPVPKNPLKYFDPHHKRVAGPDLPTGELVTGLRHAGWHDLTNASASLAAGGVRIALRGVDDPHLHRDRYEAVAGPVNPDANLTIGVVHAPEPSVLSRFEQDGARLLLSGHTHGGQLRVPGVGALVTNCGIDRARSRGLSRFGDAWLHVSAGLGTSPHAPVRFWCRPEATLLTLTPVSDPAGVG